MRYITREDRELIKSIQFIYNSAVNEEKVYHNLEENYKKNPFDAEAAFAFGFYNFLLASKVKNSTIGSERIEVIFNAFHDALKIIPDYWLVQMFLCVLILSLPEVMRNEDELEQTLENMIHNQKNAEKQKSYFIVPYIIYADYKFSHGEREEVIKILQEAKDFIIKEPIKFSYINTYFCMPFKDFLRRLCKSNEQEIAEEIAVLGNHYFPEEALFKQDYRKALL